MKKIQIILLMLLGIVLLAFITKPSEEKCREAVKEKLTSALSKLQEVYTPEGVNDTSALFNKTINIMVGNLKTEDKTLYRNIFIEHKGRTEKVGWAAFGIVKLTGRK